jgi:hypothetical protein
MNGGARLRFYATAFAAQLDTAAPSHTPTPRPPMPASLRFIYGPEAAKISIGTQNLRSFCWHGFGLPSVEAGGKSG